MRIYGKEAAVQKDNSTSQELTTKEQIKNRNGREEVVVMRRQKRIKSLLCRKN